MIRLLTSIAGTPQHHAGDVVTLAPETEAAWIDAGLAEVVRDQIERAVIAPPENAMRHGKGRRRAR
jgi:hypothetical protein